MSSYLTPSRLVLEVQAHYSLVLLKCPLLLDHVRVQMMVPTLSALLADTPWQLICNFGPVFGTVGEDETGQLGVLFLGPRSRGHFLLVGQD